MERRRRDFLADGTLEKRENTDRRREEVSFVYRREFPPGIRADGFAGEGIDQCTGDFFGKCSIGILSIQFGTGAEVLRIASEDFAVRIQCRLVRRHQFHSLSIVCPSVRLGRISSPVGRDR